MKTAGIVAEYNPFHNGHKYHIEKTKELTGADSVVAVMSGNFVQRGETAILSKWARAKAAIDNGVDLVIELPTLWSIARAQSFAGGAVSLLKALGCVDVISFGSECGDIDKLRETAFALSDEAVVNRMKDNLEIGMSFAGARAEAVRTLKGDDFFDILNEPNNTLGVEYIIANEN
ncbi:MAG: nucleotidyltransferase family protein, partial [Acutalibacteraceae bacterium]